MGYFLPSLLPLSFFFSQFSFLLSLIRLEVSPQIQLAPPAGKNDTVREANLRLPLNSANIGLCTWSHMFKWHSVVFEKYRTAFYGRWCCSLGRSARQYDWKTNHKIHENSLPPSWNSECAAGSRRSIYQSTALYVDSTPWWRYRWHALYVTKVCFTAERNDGSNDHR